MAVVIENQLGPKRTFWVDSKESMELARRYQIMASPTYIIFVDGEERTRVSGRNAHLEAKKLLAEL